MVRGTFANVRIRNRLVLVVGKSATDSGATERVMLSQANYLIRQQIERAAGPALGRR